MSNLPVVPASKRTADFCAISAKRPVTGILNVLSREEEGKRKEENEKKIMIS